MTLGRRKTHGTPSFDTGFLRLWRHRRLGLGRATHRHTGRRQLCPLRRQHVAGRLQIIVTGLAVVRLSLSPRLVSPGSYEAAGQIGPLPRPQDALYEPERRWARYAGHRILHLIVAERVFYRRLPSNRRNSLCLRRGQRENPDLDASILIGVRKIFLSCPAGSPSSMKRERKRSCSVFRTARCKKNSHSGAKNWKIF